MTGTQLRYFGTVNTHNSAWKWNPLLWIIMHTSISKKTNLLQHGAHMS
jgi:hypothetical protein